MQRPKLCSEIKNQRGFGLLEVAVATFIMAGSLMVLTTTVGVNNDSAITSESKAVMQSFLLAAKNVLSTEEGCRKNFRDITWTGTSSSFINLTQIVDHQNKKVVEIGERVGKYVFKTATLKEGSKTRTTATHDYHQAIIDFSLSDAETNAVYQGNSLRIPVQLVVDRATSRVVSCYSIGADTPFATQVELPSCGSGQTLNGLRADGTPICVPLDCTVPPPLPTNPTCKAIGETATIAELCCSGCKEPIGTTTAFRCAGAAVCGPGVPPPGQDLVVSGVTCNGCPGGAIVAPPPCVLAPIAGQRCAPPTIAFGDRLNAALVGSDLSNCNRGNDQYWQACPGNQTVPLGGGVNLNLTNVTARRIVNADGYSGEDLLVSINQPTNTELTALGVPTPVPGAPVPGVNVLVRGGTTVATESYVPVTYAAAIGGVAQGQVNRDPAGNVLAGAVTYTMPGLNGTPTPRNVTELYEAVPNPTPGQPGTCQRQTNLVDGAVAVGGVCVTCGSNPPDCN